MKKRIIIPVVLIVVMAILALTASYALFTFNITKNTIFKAKIGLLELTITDTKTEDKIVINDLVPIKDNDALSNEGYSFILTNTGTIDASYIVYLDNFIPENELKERLSDSLIKVNLSKKNNVNNSKTNLLSNLTDRVLDTGVLKSGQSVEYELRIWLDYNAGNDSQNKYFASKIRVDSIQNSADKTLRTTILRDNEIKTILYQDNGFNSEPIELPASHFTDYYITYSEIYTFDSNTGKYSAVNPQVCKYSECYETLRGKYIFGISSEEMIMNNGIEGVYVKVADASLETLSLIVPDNTASGLYALDVENGFGGTNGTTYYFRGNVTNNYVDFANKTWRIVRINEDGTIRLILDDSIDENEYVFNSNYSGYTQMYYSNSEIKPTLDAWYSNNITGTNATKIVTGNYFCEAAKVKNDSSYTSGSASMALYNSYTPDYKCQTDGNSKGLVNASVGLITYDEVVRAGVSYDNLNQNFYLYKNYDWWTMSPAGVGGNSAYVWDVNYSGNVGYSIVNYTHRLRPVINLKADTLATKDESTGHYIVRD